MLNLSIDSLIFLFFCSVFQTPNREGAEKIARKDLWPHLDECVTESIYILNGNITFAWINRLFMSHYKRRPSKDVTEVHILRCRGLHPLSHAGLPLLLDIDLAWFRGCRCSALKITPDTET